MNFNKKEIDYHGFSNFLQLRYVNNTTHLLGGIAANLIIFYESSAMYGHTNYDITLREMQKLLPIGMDNLIAAFNFLKAENLLDAAPKTIDGQNEIMYFPTELFYNYKNDYIQMFETKENIEEWNKWFKDFTVKNEVTREFSEYIVERLGKRPTEISHLKNLIYHEILVLIKTNNPNEINNMKKKLYIMIDEYARRK